MSVFSRSVVIEDKIIDRSRMPVAVTVCRDSLFRFSVQDIDLIKVYRLLPRLRRHVSCDQLFKDDRSADQDRNEYDHGDDASKLYAASLRNAHDRIGQTRDDNDCRKANTEDQNDISKERTAGLSGGIELLIIFLKIVFRKDRLSGRMIDIVFTQFLVLGLDPFLLFFETFRGFLDRIVDKESGNGQGGDTKDCGDDWNDDLYQFTVTHRSLPKSLSSFFSHGSDYVYIITLRMCPKDGAVSGLRGVIQEESRKRFSHGITAVLFQKARQYSCGTDSY